MNFFYKYIGSCFDHKITPEKEQKEEEIKREIKKQRLKMLLPFYRPDIYT
tara:strand:+ start:154 stop:303 length:150 start_codon:yes stop_codon:yes gene_type:complete